MDEAWQNDAARFIRVLQQVQNDLQHTFELKRLALVAGDAASLEMLNQREEESIRRFQSLQRWRSLLIENASRSRSEPFKSLQEAIAASGVDDRAVRLAELKAASQHSAHLQHQSWALWILATQVTRHFESVLEIIDRRGERDPTYGKQSWGERRGGVILDSVV